MVDDYGSEDDDEGNKAILRANNNEKRTLASLWDTLSKDSREIDVEELKDGIR